jgi:hypothetical protein
MSSSGAMQVRSAQWSRTLVILLTALAVSACSSSAASAPAPTPSSTAAGATAAVTAAATSSPEPSAVPSQASVVPSACIDRGELGDDGEGVTVAMNGVIVDLIGPLQPPATKLLAAGADMLESARAKFPAGLSMVEEAQADMVQGLQLAGNAGC